MIAFMRAFGASWGDADAVRLNLEESFSFHVAIPEATVALTG
jgi:hypothetical protein